MKRPSAGPTTYKKPATEEEEVEYEDETSKYTRAMKLTGDQELSKAAVNVTRSQRDNLTLALAQPDSDPNLRNEWQSICNLGYGKDKKLQLGQTSSFLCFHLDSIQFNSNKFNST